jgi:FkbM family methyltransferase
MPHGADVFFDIGRRYGRDKIRIAFDVGANIGQSAIKYVEELPQADIYSFEPVNSTYQQLVANTRDLPRIHPFNLGMGSTTGETTININELSVMNSIGLKREGDRSETIQLDTIANFVTKHGLPRIDFLKTDTEGFDLEVLAGAAPLLQQQKIHLILTECEPFPRTKQFVSLTDLAEFLRRFGYELSGVYEQQPEWDGKNRILYWNALFVCGKLIDQNAKWQ